MFVLTSNSILLRVQTFLCLLQVLTKWGEYSNDVQFILQRSGSNNQRPSPLSGKGSTSPPPSPNDQPPERNKDIRKSLTFSGCGGARDVKRGDNIGVVRGVPHSLEVKQPTSPDQSISSQMVSLCRQLFNVRFFKIQSLHNILYRNNQNYAITKVSEITYLGLPNYCMSKNVSH